MEWFCEMISAPWWTFANTIVVVIIAIKQYSMQRWQTKMQEYDQYKELYRLISAIDYELNGVTSNVLNSVYSVFSSENNIKRLGDYNRAIENLRSQLFICRLELELKLKAKFDFELYDGALEKVSQIYARIINLIRSGSIKIDNDPLLFISLCSDKERFDTLLNSMHEKEREQLKKYFNEYHRSKQEILKNGVLEQLEEHCKL